MRNTIRRSVDPAISCGPAWDRQERPKSQTRPSSIAQTFVRPEHTTSPADKSRKPDSRNHANTRCAETPARPAGASGSQEPPFEPVMRFRFTVDPPGSVGPNGPDHPSGHRLAPILQTRNASRPLTTRRQTGDQPPASACLTPPLPLWLAPASGTSVSPLLPPGPPPLGDPTCPHRISAPRST